MVKREVDNQVKPFIDGMNALKVDVTSLQNETVAQSRDLRANGVRRPILNFRSSVAIFGRV